MPGPGHEYNPAIHNPSSMGAGTGGGGKGNLLFNAIPHVAMKGSIFSAVGLGGVSPLESVFNIGNITAPLALPKADVGLGAILSGGVGKGH